MFDVVLAFFFACRYNKPAEHPQPSPVLHTNIIDADLLNEHHTAAERRDLLWKVGCFNKPPESQPLPSWSGFNSVTSDAKQLTAIVRYLPFIRSPPTDFDTIYTILVHLVKLAESLDQSHILVTADMAIYSRAQEILWAQPAALAGKVTMRIGGMHLTMAFLASLGTLFGDGGPLHLLCDYDVFMLKNQQRRCSREGNTQEVSGP